MTLKISDEAGEVEITPALFQTLLAETFRMGVASGVFHASLDRRPATLARLIKRTLRWSWHKKEWMTHFVAHLFAIVRTKETSDE